MIEFRTALGATGRRSLPALAHVRKSCFVLALLAAMPGFAQVIPNGRSTIRLEQVVAALKLAKLPLEDAEVRLLAQNTASTAEPRLEVRGVEPWGDRAARVRIRCVSQEQCVPFFVGVSWADAAQAKAALHFSPGTLFASKSDSQTDAQSGAFRRALSNAGATAMLTPAPAQVGVAEEVSHPGGGFSGPGTGADPAAGVHAGSRATLLIDGQRLHIKLPVICLGKGLAGSTIRVTALDHKQSYLAEVIDSTLLKLTL